MLAILACSAAPARPLAADEPQLTARDVSVFQISAYGQQFNARDLFRSALPATMPSQRLSAPPDDANVAAPVGIITFEGAPVDDVDVSLDFSSGRFLAHWPPGSKRSLRMLWPAINVRGEPGAEIALLPGHWLAPLSVADRMYVHSGSRSSRYLLYDAEIGSAPPLQLTIADGLFQVKNSSGRPLHDVTIYEPADGGWKVAGLQELPGSPKPDQPAKSGDDVEAVFEKPAQSATTTTTPDEAAVKEAVAQPAVEAPQAAAAPVAANAPAPAPAPAPASAAGATPATGEGPAAEGEKPMTAAAVVAPYSRETPVDAETALAPWRARLGELGLGESEIAHVLGILKARALRSDATMAVFRLDPEALEELLPLEITPLPDRIVRVSLVILQDADPKLEAEVDGLIAQLGDPAWKTRMAAHERLRELARAALPKLRAALDNKDVEIAFRAEQLLEQLETAGQ